MRNSTSDSIKRNGNTQYIEGYFDKDLYNESLAAEHTNAWMDSFRFLLNRFDTTIESWKGFNYLAFSVIALKKFKKRKTKKAQITSAREKIKRCSIITIFKKLKTLRIKKPT